MFMDLSILEMIVLRDVLQSQPVNFCRILDVSTTFVKEINFLPTIQDKAKSGKLLQA